MSKYNKRLVLKFDPITCSKIKKIADERHKPMSSIIVHIIEETLKLERTIYDCNQDTNVIKT